MADSLLDESITIKDIKMRKYALFLGIIFMFGGFVVSSAQKIGGRVCYSIRTFTRI